MCKHIPEICVKVSNLSRALLPPFYRSVLSIRGLSKLELNGQRGTVLPVESQEQVSTRTAPCRSGGKTIPIGDVVGIVEVMSIRIYEVCKHGMFTLVHIYDSYMRFCIQTFMPMYVW